METARVIVAEEELSRLDNLKKYIPPGAVVAGFAHVDFNPNDYVLEHWETVVDVEYTTCGGTSFTTPTVAPLSHDNAKRFILAGNATVTFASQTGTRFTFRIRAKKVDDGAKTLHFVSVLTGADNESSFTFLGTIFDGQTFRHGRKSRIGQDAPSARAFAWAFPRIMADADLKGMEIHHEGKCGMCGRKLTVPESIETGLGPVCAGR